LTSHHPYATSHVRVAKEDPPEEHYVKYQARWNGAVIASSDQTVEVEGNQYFPADSVVAEHLAPSDHSSVCSWKGTASYYDVTVDGEVNANAAWYYPETKDAAKHVRGYIAFWKGVTVEAVAAA
jgi:uncharacterized protein (DUF427 family)